MDVKMPKNGKYVVAVSGGVDSMVLLDILVHAPSLELVIAHVDHGIRDDSSQDLELVRVTCNNLELEFNSISLNLGANTSEEVARKARYDFLYSVQKQHNAAAIITAHHQDDLLETAILNMLRGTGRKGLSALADNPDVIRPLINVSKKEILEYAKANNIEWHEDSTNSDEMYLRNYVRSKLVSKLTDSQKQKLIKEILAASEVNQQIDTLLVKQLHLNRYKNGISRQWFNGLPHDVAGETMAAWLRLNNLREFDKKTIQRLVVASKTSKNDKKQPIIRGSNLLISKEGLALELAER